MREIVGDDMLAAESASRSMLRVLARPVRDQARSIAYLTLVELAAEYDPAWPDTFRACLWRRVVCRLKDEAKSERARRGREARYVAENRPRRHPDPAWRAMIRDEIRHAFARLESRDRRIFRLVYLRGLSHAEAAAVMGLSSISVSTYLCRARKTLRTH